RGTLGGFPSSQLLGRGTLGGFPSSQLLGRGTLGGFPSSPPVSRAGPHPFTHAMTPVISARRVPAYAGEPGGQVIMAKSCGCGCGHRDGARATERYPDPTPVGEAARDAAGRAVLEAFGLNHCCGAHLTLREGAA